MTAHTIRAGLSQILSALEAPEDFAQRWQTGAQRYPTSVWLALMLTAIAGTLTYGMTMGILGGAPRVVTAGLSCTLAAGLAWGISLPALYIINSIFGSRLSISSTVLAALVTTSWGGLAMIASIPINWFFTVAVPYEPFILAVNLLIFTGVGIAMIDVFGRIMQRLEPGRGRLPTVWLLLVAAIGGELFYFFDLFNFTVGA